MKSIISKDYFNLNDSIGDIFLSIVTIALNNYNKENGRNIVASIEYFNLGQKYSFLLTENDKIIGKIDGSTNSLLVSRHSGDLIAIDIISSLLKLFIYNTLDNVQFKESSSTAKIGKQYPRSIEQGKEQGEWREESSKQ